LAGLIAICNGEAIYDRVSILAAVEIEAATGVLAVDYCCGDYVIIFRPDASEGYGLAFEINVPVGGASIYAGEKHNDVAIVGVIYCRLNCGKVGPSIVINDNYSGCAGNG
jgi:hypothetical protein